MLRYLLLIGLFGFQASAYGVLAGGRPNTFSEGNNSFAGIVNPANAVWIPDRFDVGAFWFHQRSTLENKDNNPNFPLGKLDRAYGCKNRFTTDFAIQKHLPFRLGSKTYDSTFGLASYTVPSFVKVRTQHPVPSTGTTPILVMNKTEVISAVYSLKLSSSHSLGFSIDYFYFSHNRDGFQNSDNPLRSVSPGHVTNNGIDHSSGFGCSLGWRWKMTEKLNFGIAWVKKTHCGQYRKYRGYEPYHANNYIPQTVGGGFSYHFTTKISGRIEVLWSNLGNVPGSNNNVLPDGSLNLNKRGSDKSPGPGLQDATFINAGIGCKLSKTLAMGLGLSHRIKSRRGSNILSHTYMQQTVYDILSLGTNYRYKKNDFFLVFSYAFTNRMTGSMPLALGGGEFESVKQNISASISWGYLY